MSLWTAIKNRVRSADAEAAAALADPAADAKLAIADAKKEIEAHQTNVATLVATNKGLGRDITAAQAEVEKYLGIAQNAAKAGNTDDARQALELKNNAATRLATLQAQFAANDGMCKQLREQLATARAKVAAADADQARLSAQLAGAKLRKDMAQAAGSFDAGSGAFAKLGELKKAADLAECDAEAHEELAGAANPGAALAEKYGAGTSNVDAELAALMGTAKS